GRGRGLLLRAGLPPVCDDQGGRGRAGGGPRRARRPPAHGRAVARARLPRLPRPRARDLRPAPALRRLAGGARDQRRGAPVRPPRGLAGQV
ncbi:hypothetical protein EG859_15235, partial [Enterococcus faecalis]